MKQMKNQKTQKMVPVQRSDRVVGTLYLNTHAGVLS